jgi:hypothetical protein
MGRGKSAMRNISMRSDLLTLTIDDLITLSNRGLVKRAQQEVASTELTGQITEDPIGNVTVQWSDAIRCTLPAHTTLAQSQCSCPATTLCRHLLRSVLCYQAQSITTTAPIPETPWNPGTIADEVLQKYYTKAVLTKLRSQYDAGQVVGVTCGIKPVAHLHSLSLNLRFLVPDDIRYTHCDCNETAPCSHIPLAIWAFRQLPAGVDHGLISTQAQPLVVPTDLLDELETHLFELANVGIAGMNQILRDRFARLESRCRQAEIVWIAEIILDLIQAYEHYQQHDAQFDAEQVVNWIGELLIRSDAIRNHTAVNNPVPPLFIRGSAQDTTVTLGAARLVGLGCGATIRSSGVTLTAYLQDVDSGTVVALPRYFANPDPTTPPKPLWQLAQSTIGKGMQLGAIGSGQLLIKGGKRTPSYQLIPGRSPISLNPQSFQWEKLRSPLFVDDFAELTDRLQALPPVALRPRRVTAQLQVLAIAAVLSVEFDPVSQSVRALVADRAGNQATIVHPYVNRSRDGLAAMLQALSPPDRLKFLSAKVSVDHQGLVFAPIALVLQSGETRQMLQPWVAPPQVITAVESATTNVITTTMPQSTIAIYRQELTIALQDLWLVGLDRADQRHLEQWQRLSQQGQAIGFNQFLRPIDQLTTALAQKFHTLDWDSQPAQVSLAIVTALHQMAETAGPSSIVPSG